MNVTASQRADDLLASIDDLAERQAGLVEHIQRLSNEQTVRTSAVVDTIVEVAALVNNTVTDAYAVAEAVAHQAELVERLRASVDAFKLNESLPTIERVPQLASANGIEGSLNGEHGSSPSLSPSPPESVKPSFWLRQSQPGNGLLSQARRRHLAQSTKGRDTREAGWQQLPTDPSSLPHSAPPFPTREGRAQGERG